MKNIPKSKLKALINRVVDKLEPKKDTGNGLRSVLLKSILNRGN